MQILHWALVHPILTYLIVIMRRVRTRGPPPPATALPLSGIDCAGVRPRGDGRPAYPERTADGAPGENPASRAGMGEAGLEQLRPGHLVARPARPGLGWRPVRHLVADQAGSNRQECQRGRVGLLRPPS